MHVNVVITSIRHHSSEFVGSYFDMNKLIVEVILQTEIPWLQVFKSEYLLLFVVLVYSKLHIFGFWTVDWQNKTFDEVTLDWDTEMDIFPLF